MRIDGNRCCFGVFDLRVGVAGSPGLSDILMQLERGNFRARPQRIGALKGGRNVRLKARDVQDAPSRAALYRRLGTWRTLG